MDSSESTRPISMLEWVNLVVALKAVAVHGTYRSAAAAGHGTAESLRARVARLEVLLERRLLTRTRPAQLTAAGRDMLGDWEAPLRQLEQVWSRTSTRGPLLYGETPVVVRCPSRFAATCLPVALASPRVSALGLGVRVELSGSSGAAQGARSERWDLDVTVRQRRPRGAFEQLIGCSAQVLCVASGSASSDVVAHPLDLADVDWVVDGDEPSAALVELSGPDGAGHRVRVPRTHRAPTAAERLALVRAGLGAGRFAMCELDAPLQVLGLRRLLPGFALPPACVVAATRPGSERSVVLDALVLALREAFAEREPQIHGAAFG